MKRQAWQGSQGDAPVRTGVALAMSMREGDPPPPTKIAAVTKALVAISGPVLLSASPRDLCITWRNVVLGLLRACSHALFRVLVLRS